MNLPPRGGQYIGFNVTHETNHWHQTVAFGLKTRGGARNSFLNVLDDLFVMAPAAKNNKSAYGTGLWSTKEHDLFLEALKKYPQGPWRAITEHIGTRSVRQVQKHAQKYQEKIARRLRGVRKSRSQRAGEHRIDEQDALRMRFNVSSGKRRANTSLLSHINVSCQGNDEVTSTSPASPSMPTPFSHSNDQRNWNDQSTEVFEDAIHANDLPTLGESLDFFIECFSR